MKYIVLQVIDGDFRREVPVIFPDLVCHDDMALWAAEAVRAGHPNPLLVKAVSAGFCNVRVNTHGKSETLGLSSRPKDDSLINMFDYYHGIV